MRPAFFPLTLSFFAFTAGISGHASPARPVVEIIEHLSKIAGRPAASGAAEALGAALAREGSAALEAARRGGLGLPEAAARLGDEVFHFAVRIPEAAPALAARAETLLPLARHYGDDVLRLEAKLPGLGDDAARLFPSEGELRRLGALPTEEARQIISFAAHATDSEAPGLLLRAVEKGGSKILRELDAKQILAIGLTSAMVVAAAGGAVSVASAPEEFVGVLRDLGMPASWVFGLTVLAIGTVIVIWLVIRLIPSRHKGRA